jgi:hypothetical protein
MSSFKSPFDLSEKQKEILDEITKALNTIDFELSLKLVYFLEDIMEEAYYSGAEDYN